MVRVEVCGGTQHFFPHLIETLMCNIGNLSVSYLLIIIRCVKLISFFGSSTNIL